MAGITIQKASPTDCSQLVAIENECFDSDKITPRQMRYLLSKAKAINFIARFQGEVAGYCVVFIPKLPRPARLYSIAVRAEYRGMKVALHLMDAAMKEVARKGYTSIRLEVSNKNSNAQSLYRRLGFYPVSYLSKYYEDGCDGVRMQYDIPDLNTSI